MKKYQARATAKIMRVNQPNMKAALPIFLILLAGCGSSSDAPEAAAPIKGVFTELTAEDMKALITTGLKRPPGTVMVTEPVLLNQTLEESKIPFIETSEYRGDTGYLRNPGLRVVILTSAADGRTLVESDHLRIEKIAKEKGFGYSTETKITPKLGPDGKTPIILRNAFKKEDLGGEDGRVTSTIGFKTQDDAIAAKPYIGPGYKVEIAYEPTVPPIPVPGEKPLEPSPMLNYPWVLKAFFTGKQEDSNPEMTEFDRLANAIDGMFVTTYFGG